MLPAATVRALLNPARGRRHPQARARNARSPAGEIRSADAAARSHAIGSQPSSPAPARRSACGMIPAGVVEEALRKQERRTSCIESTGRPAAAKGGSVPPLR